MDILPSSPTPRGNYLARNSTTTLQRNQVLSVSEVQVTCLVCRNRCPARYRGESPLRRSGRRSPICPNSEGGSRGSRREPAAPSVRRRTSTWHRGARGNTGVPASLHPLCAAGSLGSLLCQVTHGNMGLQTPILPGPACNRGHQTHRGARQDHERPQLLSEAGQQQAALPAALWGLGARPGRGLQRRLHVPGAVLARSSDARGPERTGWVLTAVPAPLPPPPAPPPARARRRVCDLGRAPCTSAHQLTRAGFVKEKHWKLTGRAPEPRQPSCQRLRSPPPGVSPGGFRVCKLWHGRT
jgi:hypothetical protein